MDRGCFSRRGKVFFIGATHRYVCKVIGNQVHTFVINEFWVVFGFVVRRLQSRSDVQGGHAFLCKALRVGSTQNGGLEVLGLDVDMHLFGLFTEKPFPVLDGSCTLQLQGFAFLKPAHHIDAHHQLDLRQIQFFRKVIRAPKT